MTNDNGNPINWLPMRKESRRYLSMAQCVNPSLFRCSASMADTDRARRFIAKYTTYEGLLHGATMFVISYDVAFSGMSGIVSIGLIPPAGAR